MANIENAVLVAASNVIWREEERVFGGCNPGASGELQPKSG
jgi:hypothetical protein